MRFFTFFLFISTAAANHCIEDNRYPQYWKELAANQLEKKLANYRQKNQALLNSAITESYAELGKDFDTELLNELSIIAYLYSHASFHLGRIPRYGQWKKEDPVGKQDKGLVFGQRLRRLLKINSSIPGKVLMSYSRDLYLELSWSLWALKLCGRAFMLEMVSDPNLKLFYTESSWDRKMESFITYEQGYLQKGMYANFFIKKMVKSGLIDEMRWIPFAGQVWPNFKQWCDSENCQSSSWNLQARIAFDLWSIKQELEYVQSQGLRVRWEQSRALSVNRYFQERYSSFE